MSKRRQQTVIAYVDGFNLYYGLLYAKYTKLKWLDLLALSNRLVGVNQTVVEVNYFTSLINDPEDKRLRQLNYVNALIAHSGCHVIKGNYVRNIVICKQCGFQQLFHSEKMTDVNIASKLITDSIERRSDVALIVSGDSDLVPAIIASKRICPERKILARFPPERPRITLQPRSMAALSSAKPI
ncbi:MAG: NYN domain-containing protein [Gemmataceae bacterium]